jgi:Ras-related protein Rab-1A
MDFVRRLFSSAPEPQTVSLALSSKTRDDSQTMMIFGATAARYQAAAVTEQAAQKPYDALYKVVLMGESGAGKSSLLKRFTNDSFSNSYCSTIGVDFATKTLAFDGTVVKLQVWDTSGQERFRSITSSYYRGASCVMMIYSVDSVDSFRGLGRWLDEVRRYCSLEVAVMVVACKSDLSAIVDEAEARQWASDNDCLFAVTSAKLNHGVFEAFESLARATSQGRLSGAAVPSLDKAVAAKAVDQTNVLRVELSQLQSALQLVTGEPLRCGGCGAMFNWLSQAVPIAAATVGDKKLKAVELAPPLHPSFQSLCPRASVAAPSGNDNNNDSNSGMIWECEFCCRANRLDASEAELSEFRRGATMDFLVRPAEQQEAGAEESGAVSIFVIDCSGR